MNWIFPIVLAMIAMVVVAKQWQRNENAWCWVVLYWAILTLKNLMDAMT